MLTARVGLVSVFLLAGLDGAAAQPLGTAFTYQGRLVDGVGPANGTYDVQLLLYDAAVGGSQQGPIVSKNDVLVTDGLFTVTLDFGAVFGASKRFLEVGVRPGSSSGSYTVLSPRQELTPVPNALFSTNAGTVGGLACGNGQVAKWSGDGWTCGDDLDTDTNSGGDITEVSAGDGLTGGGKIGVVIVNAGSGTGIVVSADAISLDTAYTDARYDPRYLNTVGDSMTGMLDMNQQRVLNRGCPPGYVRHGPGLCLQDFDQGGLTFSGCANRCRVSGTHLCSSAEIRAVMQSGLPIGNGGVIDDWVDDQDTVTTALVIKSNTDTNAFIALPVTSTTFCRCCANVE